MTHISPFAHGGPRLLLFDIDGTLLRTGGAGRISMERSFEKLYGLENALDSIPMMGRTDPLIFRDVLEKNGIMWNSEHEEQMKKTYFSILRREIRRPRKDGKICPGIVPLLDACTDDTNLFLGLLTGNYRESARIKLKHFGLDSYFPFGAFADDSAERSGLGKFAIERFSKTRGFSPAPDRVFIIGDTPSDIACARPYNFKTIAVATGIHTCDELKEHNPDAVYSDFSSYDRVLSFITGNNR